MVDIATPQSYQLLIWLDSPCTLCIGALGRHALHRGLYLYTGSARRHMQARLQRHLRRDKPLRWHIDYVLSAAPARIIDIAVSHRPECELCQAVDGRIPVPGLGASDCRAGCDSHLCFLGDAPWAAGLAAIPGAMQ